MEAKTKKLILIKKKIALNYKSNLTVDTGELGKKMKISNEVFDYHTQLYLIFFKTNITDLNLSVAIEKKDLGVIQQNANALLQYADEGLEKLKTMKAFGNDNTMVIVTKKVLEYYKKQAQQYVPKVVDFLMFNEKFDNARKSLEAKSDKDKTKEEVDNYNGMVKQINKEIENYNKANSANFQEKNMVITNWNNTGDNFISSHVPAD